MPAVASLEDLNSVAAQLGALKERHPQAYVEFAELFRRYRAVGYKNVCKLLLNEATPEKLKGLG
jgi:hypothetical protein